MRRLVVTIVLLLAGAAPAAAQWGDTAQVATDGPATCLRDAGAGQFATLAAQGRRDGVAFASAGEGIAASGSALLGTRLWSCPVAAAGAAGAAIAAGVHHGAPSTGLRQPQLRVTVRDGPGGFGPVRTLSRGTGFASWFLPVVAVAPGGRMLVAWTEEDLFAPPGRVVLRAVLREPGGGLGAPVTLGSARAGGPYGVAPVAAFAADGTATVAWLRPSRRGPGIHSGVIEVLTAPPGAPFGAPVPATRRLRFVRELALAVAPDGRALLAHDADSRRRVLERPPGVATFAPVTGSGGGQSDASAPAVALAPDGGAVVAWRERGGVRARVRTAPGPFAPIADLQPAAMQLTGGFGISFTFAGTPADTDDGRLRVAAADGGRSAVAWIAPVALPGAPVTGRLALGTGTAFAPPVVLGGPLRDVDGVLPLLGDVPGAVWTDNAQLSLGSAPVDGGRLHLARAGAPVVRRAPPRISVSARPRALYHGQPLPISVRCAAACDVRATIAPRRTAVDEEGDPEPAVGGGGRASAGRARVDVFARGGNHVAPPDGGRVRVVVRATAPGGTDVSRAVARVVVRRRPIPPVRRPLDVRVRRRGDRVVVTWRTAGPARRQQYFVAWRPVRRRELPVFVGGAGRSHFRAVLRGGARGRDGILLSWNTDDPPQRTGRMRLRVP